MFPLGFLLHVTGWTETDREALAVAQYVTATRAGPEERENCLDVHSVSPTYTHLNSALLLPHPSLS